MLDKLIANLKQSLPESLRKKMGGEEINHDEESSEHSEEQNEESHDTSDNAEEAPAEDKKKKQISMLIRVVVVLGLGYMAVTEFVLKPDNNEVPTVAAKPHKSRKKVPAKGAEVKPGETKTAETKPAENKPAEVTKPAEGKPEDKTAAAPPEEKKPEEKKPEAKAESKPEETKPEETKTAETQAPVENVNIADKKTETPPAETAPQVGEVKTPETQVEKSLDSLIDSVDNKDKGGEEAAPKKETKLEDKIVADDVYTPPPSYEQLGRGLVYNCKEKFWACLDKTAYVSCNKNMKYNKGHGKPIECAVQSVYNSDEDCGVVQKYNVSSNKPTDFCQ